jgi:hypothetical protein
VAAFSVYGQLFDMTSSWSVHLPYLQGHRTAGVLPAGFGNETSGVGDLRIGYTVWPVNDRDKGQWLAVSGTLLTPTGHYDHSQSLNSGDRRWKATLQMAWVRYLSSTVAAELIPEVTFYGANGNYVGYRMTQAPAAALTTYLRWKFTPGWETQAGLQFNTGGEQTIGGRRQGNEPRNRRVFLGVSTWLSPTVKFGLRYSRDTSRQLRTEDHPRPRGKRQLGFLRNAAYSTRLSGPKAGLQRGSFADDELVPLGAELDKAEHALVPIRMQVARAIALAVAVGHRFGECIKARRRGLGRHLVIPLGNFFTAGAQAPAAGAVLPGLAALLAGQGPAPGAHEGVLGRGGGWFGG